MIKYKFVLTVNTDKVNKRMMFQKKISSSLYDRIRIA